MTGIGVVALAVGLSLLVPSTRVLWLHGLAESGPVATRRWAVEQLFRQGPEAVRSLASLACDEQRQAGPPLFEKGRVVESRRIEYGPILAELARRMEHKEAWREPLIQALGEGAPVEVAGAALIPWTSSRLGWRESPADEEPLLDAVARRWLRRDCEPEFLRYCQWLVSRSARPYEQWAPPDIDWIKSPKPSSFAGGGPIRAGHLVESIKAALGKRFRRSPGFDAVFRADAEVVSRDQPIMTRCVADLLPMLQLTVISDGKNAPPEFTLSVKPGPPVELMFDGGDLVLMSEEEARELWREWARKRLAAKGETP